MFNKSKNEDALRLSISKEIYTVQQEILTDSISWSPEKLAIIRDCFDISAKIASGWESKKIKL